MGINNEDAILMEFASTYPYSFSELKEMLSKSKHIKSAESLVKHLKDKLNREKDNYM